MSQYQWITGDLITADRLNGNSYNLFSGVSGWEAPITLADNVTGTFTLKPTSDPAVTVQLFQVQNAAGTPKGYIAADGSFGPNAAGTTNTVPVKLDEQTTFPAAVAALTPSGTYRHLRVVGYARSNGASTPAFLSMRFNGDATPNYDWIFSLAGNGSTTNVVESAIGPLPTAMNLGYIPGASDLANSFGVYAFDIPYYAQSTNLKSVTGTFSYKNANTASGIYTGTVSGWWRQAATAITQIQMSLSGDNFSSGTIWSLYGYP